MSLRTWWIGCLLVGCAAPSQARPSPLRVRARCELVSGALHCGGRRVALDELGIERPVRAAVPRLGGGLWILDEAGSLVRVDGHGQPTGFTPTDYVALSPVGGLLCALDAQGRVSCLADHAGDARCGELAPLGTPVRLPLTFQHFASAEPGQLCGVDSSGAAHCAALARPCERACLQFPDCEQPLRCADPCQPGEASVRVHREDGRTGGSLAQKKENLPSSRPPGEFLQHEPPLG
jgi:hypothetical protein